MCGFDDLRHLDQWNYECSDCGKFFDKPTLDHTLSREQMEEAVHLKERFQA